MSRLIPIALLLCLSTSTAAETAPRTLDGTGSLKAELYAADIPSAPLLIYITGGFWGFDPHEALESARGSARVRQLGLALALVTLDDKASPTQWLDDTAQLVARFKRGQEDIDPKRIYVLGHSSGAQLATLLPFADSSLEAAGIEQSDIAGVISLAGVHDLARDLQPFEELRIARDRVFGASKEEQRRYSAAHRHSAERPSFMMISPEKDLPRLARSAQRFAIALGAQHKGHVTYQIAPNTDHVSVADLGDENNFATLLVLAMTDVLPLNRHFSTMVAVHNTAMLYPHFNVDRLWQDYGDLIKTYRVDQLFRDHVDGFISVDRHQLSVLPLRTYSAIPLADLVKALDPEARFLVTRNARNERYHWPTDELDKYEGLLVIGIDDVRNLFRLGVPYQARREYSWIDPERPLPMMHRGLGAFVHFRRPEGAPKILLPRFTAPFSIPGDGLSTANSSPLEEYGDLPEELIPAFTWQNGCFSCHKIRDIGSRSFHNTAANGKAHGGYAIDLEDYPPDVWKRFVFEQRKAAGMIGAIPNVVDEAVREPIYELVNRERIGRNN